MTSGHCTYSSFDVTMSSKLVLEIPPRLQWENGHGYCGEVCVQSFGRDDFQDEHYDHIMPAIGIEFKDESQFDPEDVLIYYNLFHAREIRRVMNPSDLGGTRKSCRKNCGEGGCVPWNVDYGIAVTKGKTSDFLSSHFDEKHEFTADGVTYTYADPKKISSTGSVHYRCVPKPE